MGLGESQRGEQHGDALARHRRAAVHVQGELNGHDPSLAPGLVDQALGEWGRFVVGEHPAHDVATENVEDHVKVEVAPLHRPEELGDVCIVRLS